MFALILKFGIFLFGIIGVISQMLIPAIRGTKLFPVFRRESELRNELLDISQEMREKQLEEEVQALRKKLASVKGKRRMFNK